MSLEPTKRITVRQANALATSAQQMDLNEKRLILIAMSRIGQKDTELLKHQIPITELERWFGGDVYKAARKAAMGLLDRKIYIEGDDGSWLNFQWTTLARYIPASKQADGVACIEIKLNEELKPWLLELKERYNSAPLSILLPIPSFNSERLYEVLWHHSHAGEKHFLTYDILKLKIMLGLADKEGKAEKYKSWRDFKYVLDRAQDDFRDYTNLRFSYQGIRSGRAYQQVRFVLTLNHPEALPTTQAEHPPEPKYDLAVLETARDLEEAGFVQDPYEAITSYGVEDIRDTLKLAREAERRAATTNRPIYNLGGLVTHMLKSGVARRRRETQAADNGPRRVTSADRRRMAETLVTAFSDKRSEHARTLWESFDQDEQGSVVDIMRVELDTTTLRILDRNDWQGPSFESIRNAHLFSAYNEGFSPETKDIVLFADQEGLLTECSEEDRKSILKEANDLL